MSVDVEEWFHVLESPAAPSLETWDSLESRLEPNMDRILELLHGHGVRATFFWVGWLAERYKSLLKRCCDAGHEIASHGYHHVLPHQVGLDRFRGDIDKAKKVLEDVSGRAVLGFRVAGFGIKSDTRWAFDVIREVGYIYDSSVLPAQGGHGGISDSLLGPYFVETSSGYLLEVPMSVVTFFGHRTPMFGGGYLRLAGRPMLKWGIKRLHALGQPLIVYFHPREIDPDQPRLPLRRLRRFKYYVNLRSTMPKLKWLCRDYSFGTMTELVESRIKSFCHEDEDVQVVDLQGERVGGLPSPATDEPMDPVDKRAVRKRPTVIEKALADFLETYPKTLITA
ncbi:MAG: DUF3473 domain-containing protein [Phycisphaerales bacterium]|nr:MAG: DUF3473 domain-containing protein [Phycisphaerales bacterium]